jgi:ATP-dependent exoDNAse (exonuclease V) beta subunit
MPASTDTPARTPNLRAALNPATAKPPAECPHCGCKRVTRKGIRKKKLERVQLWQCGRCRRVATPAPAHVRNTTYPPRLILDALTTYNLGHSLAETAKRIHARTARAVPLSTLSRWITVYKPFTSYAGLRARGLALFPARKTLMRVKLYRRQVYEFAYHRPKLALLTRSDDRAGANGAPANSASAAPISNTPANIRGDDTLHARSRRQPRFAPLASFLERVPDQCPHALFRASARASQAGSAFIADNKRIAIPKENTATRMAALVLPTTGDNHARHAALQRFMLANDSTTIAVEVPIWLMEKDITAIERRWGIELSPQASTAPSEGEPRSITGHIDFLQIRNGAIHILDYKPDATTGKPFAQLTLYALALSHLTGIPLFDFKCAWFNEHQYCEFFPRTVLARKNAR